jgi:hypothetical protein
VKRFVYRLAESIAVVLALLLFPVRLLRRAASRRLRSVWTGSPIITIGVNSRAERLLGCDASSIVTQTYYVTKAFDRNLSSARRLPLLGWLVPYALFVWACVAVDRLHFFCDQGILPTRRRLLFNLLELRVYRLFGLQVFLWTYGADVRTRAATLALGEPNCCTDCNQVGFACVCDNLLQQHQFRMLAKWSTAVFSMGDMTHYTPGSRNDLFFWPLDLESDGGARYAPVFPDGDAARPLRIVHAPNHRVFKGTKYLEAAVAELRAEGEAVELVMVEGVPNDEALRIYRAADVVFDQCLAGFHGYFALEAMALGKPVLCFIREPSYLLEPERCPIVNVHVRTLKEDIRRLIHARAELPGLGRRGRAYIEEHFSVPAFSRRLERAYRALGIDPAALSYTRRHPSGATH